jgi:hypothetical protein
MHLPKLTQFATSIEIASSKKDMPMRRFITTALLLTLPLIHGCSGGDKEDSKVTQTQMDDIDSLEGTISDDMINTDESTEQAPLDAAPPPEPPKPKTEKKEDQTAKADVPKTAPAETKTTPVAE